MGSNPLRCTKNTSPSDSAQLARKPTDLARPSGTSNLPLDEKKIGAKVFMDAHQPVTLEEGDRYPLAPPSHALVAQW